ncbi:MAG: hypothetical protein U9P44_02225 [archaeon]|nr:hypothetical protein [archaeon]
MKNPTDKNSTDMSKIYWQITDKDIAELEAEKSKSTRNLLPFLKKVMPRLGATQSIFGLSIISLGEIYTDEENIIRYGTEPLVDAGILNSEEIEQIIEWYRQTEPTWNPNNDTKFEKDFEIGDKRYKLMTDCFRRHRDLNIYNSA